MADTKQWKVKIFVPSPELQVLNGGTLNGGLDELP